MYLPNSSTINKTEVALVCRILNNHYLLDLNFKWYGSNAICFFTIFVVTNVPAIKCDEWWIYAPFPFHARSNDQRNKHDFYIIIVLQYYILYKLSASLLNAVQQQ